MTFIDDFSKSWLFHHIQWFKIIMSLCVNPSCMVMFTKPYMKSLPKIYVYVIECIECIVSCKSKLPRNRYLFLWAVTRPAVKDGIISEAIKNALCFTTKKEINIDFCRCTLHINLVRVWSVSWKFSCEKYQSHYLFGVVYTRTSAIQNR